MPRKKILIFKDDLTANGGVSDIVRNFRRIDQTKFEIIVAVWNGMPSIASETLAKAGITVIFDENIIYHPIERKMINRLSHFIDAHNNIDPDNFLSLYSFPKIAEIVNFLLKLLRQYQPDYLHSFDQFSELTIGLAFNIAPKAENLTYYASRIGENALIELKLFEYFKFLLFYVHPMIDQHIVNSQFIATQLTDIEAVAPSQIKIIYNGVDLEIFFPFANKTLTPMQPVTLVMVATLIEAKGYFDLFNALALLNQNGLTHWRLLYAGKDQTHNQQRFNKILSQLALEPQVKYVGEISDIYNLLNQAQIFILPSHSEGLGTAIIEAMGCELPVVATNVGGIPEVVQDGVTGILLPPHRPDLLAQAITQLMLDPELAGAMGKKGRIIAQEKFSLERSAREFQALYESNP